jgi:hypothetical protein
MIDGHIVGGPPRHIYAIWDAIDKIIILKQPMDYYQSSHKASENDDPCNLNYF